jgi:hypothetical protein
MKYQRNGSNVDKEIREECISNIPLYPPFSPDKHDLVNKCLLHENVTDGHIINCNRLHNELNTSKGTINVPKKRKLQQLEKLSLRLMLRLLSAAEVLSWLWNWTINEKMTIRREDNYSKQVLFLNMSVRTKQSLRQRRDLHPTLKTDNLLLEQFALHPMTLVRLYIATNP